MRCALRLLALILLFSLGGYAQEVRIAHLSDTHIGLPRAPHALENLQKAVQIVNERGVDAVFVTGDIGETPRDWDEARAILKECQAPVYYVPGNHDIHSNDLDRYRHVFGDDFYKVQLKYVTFYVFDTSVFGNYDRYDAAKFELPPPSDEAAENQARMLRWMEEEGDQQPAAGDEHGVVIGLQHIPIVRSGNFPPDPRPYWTVPERARQQEVDLLKRLGIHHMIVGHWHHRDTFEYGGITWHVGAATSWLTWPGELGFDIDTISPTGEFKSEFVSLEK